ncbi:MAG: type II secretion system F family protein [Candidatus Omnitrophica bacterium]|nr:type II secretion system F family protein [Candidatus Omnitrophota bacterium]
MSTFKYVAKRGPKDVIEGVLEAEDRNEVLSQLIGQGYTPVKIVESAAKANGGAAPLVKGWNGRVGARPFNQFTRQFASLVRSQVPLLRALGILKDQTTHPGLRRVLESITDEIRQGQTLSDSMARFPSVFPPLYVSLTHSGEIAGILDKVLERMAKQADREESLRAKVRSALVYPAFVGVVGVGTVLFLLAFVLPRLAKLFAGFGGKLPLPTRLLLATSRLCQQWWFWAALAGLLAVALVLFRGQGSRGRLLAERLSLRLPLLGDLVRQIELSRFARAFGLLLEHGVPILQATEVAIPVVGNRFLREHLSKLPALLKEGGSLAASLKSVAVAPPFVVHTVAVGEEAGRAGEALIEVADFYEEEVSRLLEIAASLLEPMMILGVGAVVGFIVMAVLLPIFEMSVIAR